MRLYTRLASGRIDSTVCVLPQFEKDGEAPLKFLQFDTSVSILRGNKTGKLFRCSLFAVTSLCIHNTTLSLPTSLAVSLHCAMLAANERNKTDNCAKYRD